MGRDDILHGGLNGQSKLTPELVGQIKGLLMANPNLTLREIAHALGNVVSHQTIKTWCQRLELPISGKPRRRLGLTTEMEIHIRSILARNPRAYYSDVAKEIGVPTSTVIDWCLKRMGLPKRGTRSLFTEKLVTRLKTLRSKHPKATYGELAEKLGLPYHCVRDKVRQMKAAQR